jgi:H+/Cl- antiporter ClcA
MEVPSAKEAEPPKLADENFWYTEHAALFASTLKWAFLGIVAGVCVGAGTRLFLWALAVSGVWVKRLEIGWFHPYLLLPLALPACVWLIRTYAPTAKGHGTEAVITAVHKNFGKVDPLVAPVKLLATVLTLAFGGSVGKEGPAAQIGAAITSLFADVFKLKPEDRRKLVICGISAGFAAVFGTPVSGALFGIEVLYLGRLDYSVLFPSLVAGIVAHLVCGVTPPIPVLHESFGALTQPALISLSILFGAVFGLVALTLIETMRALGKALKRFEGHPYLVAAFGGMALIGLYTFAGDSYSGLGIPTIESALAGTAKLFVLAFLFKIFATAITLETGGSGGIVTSLFFIGATTGAALARLLHLPEGAFAAFGFVAIVAAAANTPIAACVMGMEILPAPVGVYAALCSCTAFLLVGHRSVYASQKLGMSKSSDLEFTFGGDIGEMTSAQMHYRKEGWMKWLAFLNPSRRAKDQKRP